MSKLSIIIRFALAFLVASLTYLFTSLMGSINGDWVFSVFLAGFLFCVGILHIAEIFHSLLEPENELKDFTIRT